MIKADTMTPDRVQTTEEEVMQYWDDITPDDLTLFGDNLLDEIAALNRRSE